MRSTCPDDRARDRYAEESITDNNPVPVPTPPCIAPPLQHYRIWRKRPRGSAVFVKSRLRTYAASGAGFLLGHQHGCFGVQAMSSSGLMHVEDAVHRAERTTSDRPG